MGAYETVTGDQLVTGDVLVTVDERGNVRRDCFLIEENRNTGGCRGRHFTVETTVSNRNKVCFERTALQTRLPR